MTDFELGRFGVWRGVGGVAPADAAEIERLGYGTVWLGASPGSDLETVEPLLEATDALKVATGIVNIWTAPAKEVAESFQRIEARFPGRFLLGVGAGHPEATAEYRNPYDALVEYLDDLDRGGVPVERRVLAALGPKVLKLSIDRAAGAHPYLVPPEHTTFAREILGPDAILAPEQKVVLDVDVEAARKVGRNTFARYAKLRNYVANLKRLGWTDADVADGGSDELIDALVARGTPAEIAAKLQAHLDEGADHVAVQVLPEAASPIPTLTALAPVLGLG